MAVVPSPVDCVEVLQLLDDGPRLIAIGVGCALVLVRVWEDGDRKLERRLKNWHGSGRL